MNHRDRKQFKPGHSYHVYNRGNNKNLIFRCRGDYENFMLRLRLTLGLPAEKVKERKWQLKPLPPGSFSFLSYCLMPNHFHFLIRQNTEIGIDRLMRKLATSYALYFNRKYNRVGHVFQDKFKAKVVTNETYLLSLSAYIHNNPRQPHQYPYSSLWDYTSLRNDPLVETQTILDHFNSDKNLYRKFVQEKPKRTRELRSKLQFLLFNSHKPQ